MSAKDVIRELVKHDWVFVKQKGSHIHYKKNDVKVTVPFHANKSIPTGTLRNIIKMVNFAEL